MVLTTHEVTDMNLLKTTTTYATPANAEKALVKTLAKAGLTLDAVRYLIAINADGRYAPVLVGAAYISFAVNANITVVG
jgi:hypothetical protein